MGVGKICNFRLKSSFISETVWNRFMVAIMLIGSRMWWIDPCRFRWPWVTLKDGRWGVKIFRGISLITPVPFDLERSIRYDKTYRGGRISRVSHAPTARGAVPQRSAILEVPFYLCTHPLTQNYQFWRRNTHREGYLF